MAEAKVLLDGPCSRARILHAGVLVPTSSVIQSTYLLPLVKHASQLRAMLERAQVYCPVPIQDEIRALLELSTNG